MKSVAIICLLGLAIAQQFIPIPSHPEGFTYPRKSTKAPTARFDLFFDLNCSACQGYYPEWKQFIAMEVNGQPVSELVEIYYHLIALPYHHNAFFCHKLAAFIEAKFNHATLDYIQTIFDNQGQFLAGGAADLNEEEVIDKLVTVASKGTGIEENELRKAWDGRDYEMLARTEWKYAVAHGIVGTPGVMLNGVLIQSPPFSAQDMYSQWKPYVTYSSDK